MTEAGVVGDGDFVPIGTILMSSGRSEGEGLFRVGPEESDETVFELVWAEAVKLYIRVINKKPPHKGRAFLRVGQSDFKIGRQCYSRQHDLRTPD